MHGAVLWALGSALRDPPDAHVRDAILTLWKEVPWLGVPLGSIPRAGGFECEYLM